MSAKRHYTLDDHLNREASRLRKKLENGPRLFKDPVRVDPITPAGVSVLAIAHNRHFGFDRTWPEGMEDLR